VGAALARLAPLRPRFVSPGLVSQSDTKAGFGRGVLLRDPDGHALSLVDKPG
jgi:hypothetical protein